MMCIIYFSAVELYLGVSQFKCRYNKKGKVHMRIVTVFPHPLK